MSAKVLKLNSAWRICNKIRTILAQYKIDIKEKFQSSFTNDLITPTGFLTVINSLHNELELTTQEECDLIDFFGNEKQQVNYKNFLKVLQPELDDDNGCKEFVTGLEWEDPLHVNFLSMSEHRKVNLILTKIAHNCRFRDIVLEPYFQDYEMQSLNNGTVTITHFRRILNFLGITLGVKEFRVLVKKFIKHNYTVNYVAFLDSIKNIKKWFDENGHTDCKDISCYPGNIISHDLNILPRPDFKVFADAYEVDKPCHSCENQKPPDIGFELLVLRIKKHVFDNGIKIRDFFEKFDCLRHGLITKNQFIRALEAIGVSGLHRLYVAHHDLEKILRAYTHPHDIDRINWVKFCDDIDEVFTVTNLHKQPYKVVKHPSPEIKTINRPGTKDWECLPQDLKIYAQDTVFRLRKIIEERAILIEPFFRGFDRKNNKHVTKCQMRRVFSSNSIVISDKEINALMVRYGNDMGFNYMKFLKDINEVTLIESKHDKVLEIIKKIKANPVNPYLNPKKSIIDVLAKIKNEITRKRINIDLFLRTTEVNNEAIMHIENFKKNFSAAGIILEEYELDIVCESCKVPNKPDFVNHKRFLEIMNEAFSQPFLEKSPHKHPIPYLPSPDDPLNLLNFEERYIVSEALQKFSKYPDDVTNMSMSLEDLHGKSGAVSHDNLKRAFKTAGVSELLTHREFDVLFKCFSIERGQEFMFDYKQFLFIIGEINKM